MIERKLVEVPLNEVPEPIDNRDILEQFIDSGFEAGKVEYDRSASWFKALRNAYEDRAKTRGAKVEVIYNPEVEPKAIYFKRIKE